MMVGHRNKVRGAKKGEWLKESPKEKIVAKPKKGLFKKNKSE